MKRLLLSLFLTITISAFSQEKSFRFAFISDTHIGSPNGSAEEDLRRTVADINSMTDVAFVVLTGDITELGTNEELKLAKQILDSLRIPYYIIPGNHDTGWSESGGQGFITVFGYDKFRFEHNGIVFLGCASGPYVRMSDGHIPRDAINWLDTELKKINNTQPVIFLNHYPINNQLDNWYDALDLLKKKNTIAILNGHGHANVKQNFEDIPAAMGRSNLRAKAAIGGYNLVDVRADSIIFSERKPGKETLRPWHRIKIEQHQYDLTKQFDRPSYKINDSFPTVKSKWIYTSDANVISTPVIVNDIAVFGNQLGVVQAISMKNGKPKWSYPTKGAIYSSPAATKDRIVIGSADGNVYCLSDKGKLLWKFSATAAVLGNPLIIKDTVFIGYSDHHFRALNLNTGKEIWSFDGLNGPVVSTAVAHGDQLFFGAWDRNLYALERNSGKLLWKWNNGSTVRNYSPASCIPVIKDGVIYVAAPDRYLSAIDINNGKTLWRSNEAAVRESIGISEDGKYVYGKTMTDTLVAFATSREKQNVAWKVNCKYGYEHAPSQLIEKENVVFFGTRNGRIYAVSTNTREALWAHKIDNSMVNTVRVIDAKHILASTMDGKVALIVSE